jgi:RecA-family ATPase
MGALNWNPEITKHNQRLFIQKQAESEPKSPLLPTKTMGQAEPRERPPFPLMPASQLTARPIQIEWLVENILEQGSLNLLFGEPGAGKSLFALDWAFCMAAGLNWHDYRTKQTDVVIVAGEGIAGMARRLKALECKHQIKAPDNLFISQRPVISQRPAQLLDKNNAQWVAASIKSMCPNPGLVIIDTLHRNMEGDENSSQDIRTFIAHIDNYLRPLGAAVLVVHHSGHGQKDRSRGSSSIRAAMDGEFSATKNNGGITLALSQSQGF